MQADLVDHGSEHEQRRPLQEVAGQYKLHCEALADKKADPSQEPRMYIQSSTSARSKSRTRSNRFRAKLKAKNRRRVNRMAKNRQSARLHKR